MGQIESKRFHFVCICLLKYQSLTASWVHVFRHKKEWLTAPPHASTDGMQAKSDWLIDWLCLMFRCLRHHGNKQIVTIQCYWSASVVPLMLGQKWLPLIYNYYEYVFFFLPWEMYLKKKNSFNDFVYFHLKIVFNKNRPTEKHHANKCLLGCRIPLCVLFS